jgi:hypothetical protein
LKTLITAIFLLTGFAISAQTDTVINGKRYKAVDAPAGKKYLAPLDSEFLIKDKRFRYYNNWITAGAGGQQNLSYKQKLGFSGGLDYNFHLKHHYFQLGLLITGERYGFYNNYQFHLGYGKRFEDNVFHAAVFGGISYSTGYAKEHDSVYTRKYDQPGLYLQGEIVKKITYDVGVGLAVFADVNLEQTIIGFRGILYFSNAYRGSTKGRRDN